MKYVYAIMLVVIAVNFYMVFTRHKKNRDERKRDANEQLASVKALKEVQRKLDTEQDNLAKRVELQNRTFELFDQVRKRALAGEYDDAPNDGRDAPPVKQPAEKPRG